MLRRLLATILKSLAMPVIKACQPKIIGITGSVGKTSTKEAIFYILVNSKKYHGKVQESFDGLNTEIGLPLAILGLRQPTAKIGWVYLLFRAIFASYHYRISRKYPEILVLEYASDKPGDIAYLTKIAQPNIAVITQIGLAHLHTFKNVENVAIEKITLAKNLEADGTAVLNEDNSYLKKYANQIFFDKVWFHGNSFDSAKNAAKAVANIFKISPDEIEEILKTLPLVKGRLNTFAGINNTTIIDDTYNSNPTSLQRALNFLKKTKTTGKRVAILGDMRELGEASAVEHEKIAKKIPKAAEIAFLIGPEMQDFAAPVLKNTRFPYYAFKNVTSAKEEILKHIGKGDTILIKASQNTLFLERITEMLLKNKEDKKYLCRQGKMWQQIKAKTK